MAERVRKRISKWDVPAESQIPVAFKTADDSAKVDDLNSESFSSEHESTHSSVPSDMKADTEMTNRKGPEADDFTERPQHEDNSIKIPKDVSEGLEISKHSGMEIGNKGDSMKPHESISGEHAVAKEDLKTLGQNYGTEISSAHDALKQLSATDSPKRSRASLDVSRRSRSRSRSRGRNRSRSRSPSYSYRWGAQRFRSRSPSYGSGRGPERWTDRDRTIGGDSAPCRDFAAGRCQRGSECRFLHEDSERRHSAREMRESRYERGRYSSSDSRDHSDYSRDVLNSRNIRPTAKCFDFARGRCQRGSSCKFAHHEGSSDETRERSHDRRDEYQSSGRRLEPSHRLPCKFFHDGRCKSGESCRFSHQGVERLDDISRNDPNCGDRVAAVDTANSSQWTTNECGNSQQLQSQPNENIGHQNQQLEADNPITGTSIAVQSIEQGIQDRIQPLVPLMLLNAQVQQDVSRFTVPPSQNFNVGMENLPVLPPTHTGQRQFQNGQNENLLLRPPPSSQSANEQCVNRNGQQMQREEQSKEQSSVQIRDNSTTLKVVTSEQVAKITNISATLAHFFGSGGALNPQIVTGNAPVVIQQPPGFEQKEITEKGTQANVNNSTPSIAPGGFNDSNPPSKSVGAEEKVQQVVGGNSTSKEEQKMETGQNKKEQGKDAKAMRMFKVALVDFVKDVLKPSWKEGHLSKEAHKTIVKKVVEKVTGAMQGSNIPQTPEKIDLYLSHSRAKLNKFVQDIDTEIRKKSVPICVEKL